jgi:hypothetical protein
LGKCLSKEVIEAKTEETTRRARRLNQLVGQLEETRRSWKLKEEKLDGVFLVNSLLKSYGLRYYYCYYYY